MKERRILVRLAILALVAPGSSYSTFAQNVQTTDSRISTETGSRVCVANQMSDPSLTNLGQKVNACDAALGSLPGVIELYSGATGTANIGATGIVLNVGHVLRIHAGTYTYSGDNIQIAMKDNTSVIGDGWNTILRESTTSGATNPYAVVGTFVGNLIDVAGKNSNIYISNFKIEGAAAVYGSTQQAIALQNCESCVVENVWLYRTKAIGIQAGGGSASGNYANKVSVRNNLLESVASQNLACVNCENVDFTNNKIIAPGAVSSAGSPPGAAAIDLEPNVTTDRLYNISVRSNTIDATNSITNCGAGTPCVLHGILAQNTVALSNPVKVDILDNRVIGAEITSATNKISGAGIWVNGTANTTVRGNFIQRTYDGIKISSASNYVIRDNTLLSVGFTSNSAFLIEGTNPWGAFVSNRCSYHPSSPLASGEDCNIVNTSTSSPGTTYSFNQLDSTPGGTAITQLTNDQLGWNMHSGTLFTSRPVGIGTTNSSVRLAVDGFIAAGSLTGYTFTDDLNTGLTSSAPDKLNLVTAGVVRLHVDNIGNVGLGTTSPAAKLQVANGDVYVTNIGSGVILKSPGGSCFRITVSDSGVLSASAITCP
jgi:parallel beta-helix repeat protein